MKFKDFFPSFENLLASAPVEKLDDGARYVFFSDLHAGDGGPKDDLAPNRGLIQNVLERYYLDRGFTLVLNGDIEDLSKFSYSAIREAWPLLFSTFDAFSASGRLRKILGNHDLGLLRRRDYPYELLHSLVLNRGGHRLFVFHGHQSSKLFSENDYITGFVVRFLAKPLSIRNSSINGDSRRRFDTERLIYRASRKLGLVSITGHTHRPLFESLSKYDSLRWSIEELLREYSFADGRRREHIIDLIDIYREELSRLGKKERNHALSWGLYDPGSLIIPCLFNSGCATGKKGVTALEYEGGSLSLVQWTGIKGPSAYVEREAIIKDRLEGTPYSRYVLRSESVDNVFARLELLGRRRVINGKTRGTV